MSRPKRETAKAPDQFHRLARCPNCWCGIPQETQICDYCYASLSFVEGEIWTVNVIVCSHCGHEVEPSKVRCRECGQSLRETCPACGEDVMTPDRHRCPGCGVKRAEFYEICLRQDRERRQEEAATTAKGRRLGLLIVWLGPVFVLLAAGLHYSKGATGPARAALVSGLVFGALALLLTMLVLSSRRD